MSRATSNARGRVDEAGLTVSEKSPCNRPDSAGYKAPVPLQCAAIPYQSREIEARSGIGDDSSSNKRKRDLCTLCSDTDTHWQGHRNTNADSGAVDGCDSWFTAVVDRESQFSPPVLDFNIASPWRSTGCGETHASRCVSRVLPISPKPSVRSTPEQKNCPSPVKTIHLTESSASIALRSCTMSVSIGNVSALRDWERARTITAIPSASGPSTRRLCHAFDE
ncbi:ACT-toxin biosynthesis protein 3 [Alternaria alternata]|nr:ACT-toxin biosynthesis protein 3 [Alternaria alternata]